MKRPILAFAICFVLTATAPLSAAPQTDLEAQLAAANSARDRESVAEIYRRLYERKPEDVDTEVR